MALQYQHRPIVAWPGRHTSPRKRAPFRASYVDTLALLERELGYLQATHIVFQVALQGRDIRQDGMPRADARPAHPGVILSFDSKHGPLSYPCDTFLEFEDNIRAIALSLENLRAVDRYGVTRRGEQYRGWTPLPAPAPTMEPAVALLVLCELSGTIVELSDWRDAYRLAAKAAHPDMGGSPEKFAKLQRAKEVLEKQERGQG